MSSDFPYLQVLLCFSSNPSNLVGKVFLCGRSWPQFQFTNEGTPPDFETFFSEKRPWKHFSTNVLILAEKNPLHEHKINFSWISSKAELEIWRYGKSELTSQVLYRFCRSVDYFLIDRSIGHGRYRRSIRIHLLENTVDIWSTVDFTQISVEIDRRYGFIPKQNRLLRSRWPLTLFHCSPVPLKIRQEFIKH